MRWVARLGVVALTVLILAACSGGGPTRSEEAATSQPPHVSPTLPVPALGTLPSGDPYVEAMDMFARRGVQVWVETDLVGRWLEGPRSFDEAIGRVAALARRPGVAGVKIADELGYYDDMPSVLEVRKFLATTAADLRALAPGTKILVDMVVPDMGCLPWMSGAFPQARQCATRAAAKTPAASMVAVDTYLASGDIDVLDLSTSLLDPAEYHSWGLTRDQAQKEAWAEAKRRGWDKVVSLQARKALAFPGSYPGDGATAMADVHTYIDLPVQAGAKAVDVWTWRQTYQDQVVRLMDPGGAPNPLWNRLSTAHDRGIFLLTHYTPSSVEVSAQVDVDHIAEVFRGVFVAAGTG
jgi:hypothetical protein